MLLANKTIETKIKQLWDKFWSGGISNPLTAIEQISYLLFMRRIDEIDRQRQLNDAQFKSKFSGRFRIPGTKKVWIEKLFVGAILSTWNQLLCWNIYK